MEFDREKILKNLALMAFFVFFLNFLANKFHWYFSIWYFDMLMHFLGGVFVGLFVLYLISLKFLPNFSKFFLIKTLLLVLLIGFGWEIFEMVINNYISQNDFDLMDTLSDLVLDLLGGWLSVFWFSKNKVII